MTRSLYKLLLALDSSLSSCSSLHTHSDTDTQTHYRILRLRMHAHRGIIIISNVRTLCNCLELGRLEDAFSLRPGFEAKLCNNGIPFRVHITSFIRQLDLVATTFVVGKPFLLTIPTDKRAVSWQVRWMPWALGNFSHTVPGSNRYANIQILAQFTIWTGCAIYMAVLAMFWSQRSKCNKLQYSFRSNGGEGGGQLSMTKLTMNKHTLPNMHAHVNEYNQE